MSISAVVAYCDRVPLNEYCTDHNYIDTDSDALKGSHFRQILQAAVWSIHHSGVEDIVVVNYGNFISNTLSVDKATVINYRDSKGFSEWNAKHIGIEACQNDLIITINSDILV